MQVRITVIDPYSVDQDLLDALRRSEKFKSQLIVAYSSGSRQGQERPLTVLSLSSGDTAFTASEPSSDEIRTYIVGRILWVIESDGRRFENQKEINRWSEYKSSIDASRRLLVAGLTGSPSHKTSNYVVTQIDSNHRLYRIDHKDTKVSATIVARNTQAAIGIVTLLDYIEERGGRGVWASMPGMIRHEFDWPDWRSYQNSITQESRLLRKHEPEIRNISEYPDRKVRAEMEDARYFLYGQSTIRPPSDESEYTYFKGKVRLFEAIMPTRGPIMAAVAALDSLSPNNQFQLGDKAMSTYLFSVSPNAKRLKYPTTEAEDKDGWRLLERAGLFSNLSEAAAEQLLILLPQAVVQKPLRARKTTIGKPLSNDIYGHLTLLDALPSKTRNEILNEIRCSSETSNWWHLVPPPGWSYDDLVDFRMLFSEMLSELSAWLMGSSPNTHLARSLQGK